MNKQKLILPLSIILGCIILGGSYFFGQKISQEKTTIKQQQEINTIKDNIKLIETSALEQNTKKQTDSKDDSSAKNSDDLFTKKQKCSQYIPIIKQQFEEWESIFTKYPELEEVFYSPQLDTCLKAYSLIGGLLEEVVVYAIDDLFTGKNIWQKSTGEYSDLDFFNKEIERLKQP